MNLLPLLFISMLISCRQLHDQSALELSFVTLIHRGDRPDMDDGKVPRSSLLSSRLAVIKTVPLRLLRQMLNARLTIAEAPAMNSVDRRDGGKFSMCSHPPALTIMW